MKNKTPILSFWLQPIKSDFHQLQQRIFKLSKECSTTPFPPHLTLFNTENLNVNADDFLKEAAKHYKEISLHIESVKSSLKFSETLFITFKDAEILYEMHRYFASMLGEPTNKNYSPHLSLMYKKTKCSLKESIVTLDTSIISFDTFSVVRANIPFESQQDVREMKMLYSHSI